MEIHRASPAPSRLIMALDATKARNEHEFRVTLKSVQTRGDILRGGDAIVVLGVLHKVTHPMGYHVVPDAEGPSVSKRAMEEEVSQKLDSYVNMLLECPEAWDNDGVTMEVKIIAGNPLKHVILQEVAIGKASWVILDRHFRKDSKFYIKQIPCKVAIIQDSLTVDVLRPEPLGESSPIEHRSFYSVSKIVLPIANQVSDVSEPPPATPSHAHSVAPTPRGGISSKERVEAPTDPKTSPGKGNTGKSKCSASFLGSLSEEEKIISISQTVQKKIVYRGKNSSAPILCASCGTRTELYTKDSMRFSFYEIQIATNDFSKKNLLGEGSYGFVYKGQLKDGQLIAAKVRKEASTQGFNEFNSEIHVLSFARHKNIVMLLGFCCKENLNVLVYEFICNKSLEWHLFDETATTLDWHQRYSIAIGTAKGLRFLHEECRGGPIIHRDMRPSNILLTHDFVPMLGDFGLAKWKTNDDPEQTRILGTLGYLAPEYAENGTVSIRTDVYAFGIVLLQLISGRKIEDSRKEERPQSLREWAGPLIDGMELHELIDPRIGECYDTYELYLMAKAANLCVKRNPGSRPSMGEVVRILEGKNDRFHNY
ncbi:hypothetical protein MLD38_034058 [Melastoma candidum]|uniref:Uncharacterized protein n=1 Tax=Melastoma candidum TaxID=119954 RepID=A0ACB9MCL4_9MYRT|nr:hypothetical protein MLD38_034058 [Melastoma candidum]